MPKLKQVVKEKILHKKVAYNCPKCGKISNFVTLDFKDKDMEQYNGKYCAKCYYEQRIIGLDKLKEC